MDTALPKAPFGRKALEAARIGTLSQGDITKPEVWLAELNGRRYVVKDVLRMPALLRATYGRLSIWLEACAYTRLGEVDFAPTFLGVLDPWAFVLEYFEGVLLANLTDMQLGRRVIPRMEQAVLELHKRPIAHGDLRRAANVMVSPEARIVFLDWGTSMHFAHWPKHPLLKLLLSWWQREDKRAVPKWKRLCGKDLITPHDDLLESQEPPGRLLSRKLRRVAKLLSGGR
jgi:hypothetical protein